MATLRPELLRPVVAAVRPSVRQTPSRAAALRPRTTARHKSGPYGYTQAKALVFSKYGEPKDVLRLHTHSISPSLPPKAVLVRTLVAPINPADVNTIQGTYGASPSFTQLIGTAEPSAVPGNEGCFEVVAVGPAAAELGWQKGDWAVPAGASFGAWRTHALVEDAGRDLLRVGKELRGGQGKDGLTPVQVATVSVNPCSAYRLLRDYVDLIGLSVASYNDNNNGGGGGAWFLQNGANSGVGRAAIQLGALWGLRSVNVVRERETAEATEALRAELRALGATEVVTEAEFLARDFGDRLAAWTRGGRDAPRLGLNCVGGRSAAAVAKSLAEGGTLVTYGAMARQPVQLPTGLLIFRDLRFRGFWLSRCHASDREGKRTTVEEILALIRDGKFRDSPVQEVRWDWGTGEGVLRDAVQGTLQGFRAGKGVFVFGET